MFAPQGFLLIQIALGAKREQNQASLGPHHLVGVLAGARLLHWPSIAAAAALALVDNRCRQFAYGFVEAFVKHLKNEQT